MENKNKKFYITTPIYYCNKPPHLGSAYTTLAADILARYYRAKGDDVFFFTGLDEHGAKIQEAADEENKEPQKFCDEMANSFKKAWQALNVSNDAFLRTTSDNHGKAVQKALQNLWDNGFIYKGDYKGFYCIGCEQYLTKTDLVDGKCPIHKRKPQILKEESYFFKLSQFQKQILEKIKKHKFEVSPIEREKEIISFLENEKLQDISISRKNVKWGVKLPFAPSHTSYVWVDAFLSYITGIGWEGNSDKLPRFWPPDIQFMAKDILRVHATIWPALLLALKIPLPKKLFVHGFFTSNGEKMSKSLGNVLEPIELVEKYGTDAVRYYLFREISFGKDGDVSEQRLKERYNSDLASGLGNLVSRVLTMSGTMFGKSKQTEFRILSKDIEKKTDEVKEDYQRALENLKFNEALAKIWELIAFCDKYIEQKKPWEQKQEDKQVIRDLLGVLFIIADLLQPFLPQTSKNILSQLKLGKSDSLFPRL